MRGRSALVLPPHESPPSHPRRWWGCFAYGDTALVEQGVNGIRVVVGVIESHPDPIPTVEIVPTGGVYG